MNKKFEYTGILDYVIFWCNMELETCDQVIQGNIIHQYYTFLYLVAHNTAYQLLILIL